MGSSIILICIVVTIIIWLAIISFTIVDLYEQLAKHRELTRCGMERNETIEFPIRDKVKQKIRKCVKN